jgi:exosortase
MGYNDVPMSGINGDPFSVARRYWKALTIAALVAILYRGVLRELAIEWWDNPDYSHGLLLPFVIGYLIWNRREKLLTLIPAPSNLGLVVLLGGLALLIGGELGAEFFLARFSLPVLAAGLVLFFLGWGHLRQLGFPLGLFLLAIPLPAIIFYQITFPLQILASGLGSTFLEFWEVPVLREGNLIILPNTTLEVVEACSGIRSLFTLTTLTILYGYFLENRISIRLFLVALSVPLALFCNGLRIMGTGVLTQQISPEAAEGFFHTFSGWFLFSVALVSIFAIHRILGFFVKDNQVKIPEPAEKRSGEEVHVTG